MGILQIFTVLDIRTKDFLSVLHNRGEQQVRQNYAAAFFLKKFLFVPLGYFGPENDASFNSGSAVKDFLKFCKMKGSER